MSELAGLIKKCQAERYAFRHYQQRTSPACIELFRRAFAQDRPAWDAIFGEVFDDDIERFIDAAVRQKGDSFRFRFQPEDIADAIQETRLAFWRYASKRPNLLQSGELGPLIEYLKLCAKSGVGQIARKLAPRSEESLHQLAGEDRDEGADGDPTAWSTFQPPTTPSIFAQREFVDELVGEINKLLETTEERVVAQECFLNETPPREVVDDYPHLFGDGSRDARIKQVNNTLQRIRRRIIQAPYFRNLPIARRKTPGAAFLQFSVWSTGNGGKDDSGEAMMAESEQCLLDDGTLLDYIRGVATAELRLAVERSPACVAAAQRMALEVTALTPLLRLALCPELDTLIDYHERRLVGAQQLVIHKHVQGCRLCQAEIAMFAAIAEAPVQEGPSLMRRLIEALFLPPTLAPVPIRGGTLYRTHIDTPQIEILLRTSKTAGKPVSWTLRGQLRTVDGVRFSGVDQVVIRANAPDAGEVQGSIEESGSFVFRGLASGSYRLALYTPDKEIYIRELQIGTD